ncbi:hypothetical protein [Ideonella sp. YS5]|uniref:hypothetical protein n=1 Tax=Ideonella sp. YS5 TaxID=3453714 RepID=UPI003EECD798
MAAVLLAGCSSGPSRASSSGNAARTASGSVSKSGYYSVRPCDTLGSIGLATGQQAVLRRLSARRRRTHSKP